LVKISPVDIEN